jgi:hypothetical protein
MDIFTFIVGFIIGVICVGLALELSMRKTPKAEPASRPTKKWSVKEITNPRIVAEYMEDIDLPKNSKVIVSQYKDKTMFEGMDVREHKEIKGNFILGEDRALILAGPIKNEELGFWTVEKEILDKLNTYFEESWSKGTKMKFDEH